MVKIKLIIFDVDGVLLDVEKSSFEYLAERIGQEFDAGELAEDYEKETNRDYCNGSNGLQKFAKLFAGKNYEEVKAICDSYVADKLMHNADLFVKKLQEEDNKIAIVSSNPTVLLESISEQLGADFVIGNELETEAEEFTGKIMEVLDSKALVEKTKELAKELGLAYGEAVVIASSRGRAEMADGVGTFIAFNTEEETILQKAHFIVKEKDLINVMNYVK